MVLQLSTQKITRLSQWGKNEDREPEMVLGVLVASAMS